MTIAHAHRANRGAHLDPQGAVPSRAPIPLRRHVAEVMSVPGYVPCCDDPRPQPRSLEAYREFAARTRAQHLADAAAGKRLASGKAIAPTQRGRAEVLADEAAEELALYGGVDANGDPVPPSMTLEQKVAHLRMLEERAARFDDAFRDDLVGPWHMDDGRPWKRSRSGSQLPPAHHPRRCHSPKRHEDKRCSQWAVPGRSECCKHGGRRPMIQMAGSRMPMRYKKSLMPALADRMQDMLDEPRHEQLELYEEIALARTFLEEQITLAMTLRAAMALPGTSITIENVMTSLECVQGATDHVADLVAKMAKIEKDRADNEDAISVRQVGFVVEQVARMLYRTFGDDPRIDQLTADLRDKVKLPSDPNMDTGVPVPTCVVEVSYD